MPFRRTSIDSNQRTGFYSPKRSRVVGAGIQPLTLSVSHSWSAPGVGVSLSERLGFRFTVGGSSITCRELGLFAAGTGLAERVIIHRVSDSFVMASVDIIGADQTWVNSSVTPVTLSAGVQYVISARRTSGASRTVYRNPTNLIFDSAIGSISYVFGSSDSQPTTTTANAYVFMRFKFT